MKRGKVSRSPDRSRRGPVVALLGLALALLALPPAYAQTGNPPDTATVLSPYWSWAVARWEPLILEEASRRGLDPDFIAAVIWTESLGRPHLHSPAGAVGLMGVMPREAGFSWRPTAAELEDPALNLFWGTRTLAITIQQARGDLYLALAAYNGGWEQIHLPGPQRYAEETLFHYVRAVAVRLGLPPAGPWVATIALVDERARNGFTVLGPYFPLTRYGGRPTPFRLQDAGVDGYPTVVVYNPLAPENQDGQVGLWLWRDGRVIRPSRENRARSGALAVAP